MFIGRLRELWSTIMTHSRDYDVQDTLAISKLLHVPRYYMHTGLYGGVIFFWSLAMLGVGGRCAGGGMFKER